MTIIRIVALAFSIAALLISWHSSRVVNRALEQIEQIQRPRKLTTLDEMKLRALTRDPRQPFTGDPDDG